MFVVFLKIPLTFEKSSTGDIITNFEYSLCGLTLSIIKGKFLLLNLILKNFKVVVMRDYYGILKKL